MQATANVRVRLSPIPCRRPCLIPPRPHFSAHSFFCQKKPANHSNKTPCPNIPHQNPTKLRTLPSPISNPNFFTISCINSRSHPSHLTTTQAISPPISRCPHFSAKKNQAKIIHHLCINPQREEHPCHPIPPTIIH